ncbi:MAG: hypothetical protein ACI8QZ_002553 [Chlamydiales bacterium]
MYGFTSLGSGQIDLQGHLVAHHQPARGGWFGAIETGYDRRNGTPPDEVPLHFSAGANVAGGSWVTLFYSRFDRLG